jgi:hypothetical protein
MGFAAELTSDSSRGIERRNSKASMREGVERSGGAEGEEKEVEGEEKEEEEDEEEEEEEEEDGNKVRLESKMGGEGRGRGRGNACRPTKAAAMDQGAEGERGGKPGHVDMYQSDFNLESADQG